MTIVQGLLVLSLALVANGDMLIGRKGRPESIAKRAQRAIRGKGKGRSKNSDFTPPRALNNAAADLLDGVPAYARRSEWPPTRGLSSYPGSEHERFPDECYKQPLPAKERSVLNWNGSPSGRCYQLTKRARNETQPVLPTLFVPGFPKAATTWLYECMHTAFVAEAVCPPQQGEAFDPAKWTRSGCKGRRFMLPGISCHVLGTCTHKKELFFYGAGFGDLYRAGMAALHGPELPLEMFRKLPRYTRAAKKLQPQLYVERQGPMCTRSAFTHLPEGRMHPSCCVASTAKPNMWGCRWHETLRVRHGRRESMWLQTAMPWVLPEQYEFASVDFTPNYLCSTSSLLNINASARDPSQLRFIVRRPPLAPRRPSVSPPALPPPLAPPRRPHPAATTGPPSVRC
jgi:hypothetical protein